MHAKAGSALRQSVVLSRKKINTYLLILTIVKQRVNKFRLILDDFDCVETCGPDVEFVKTNE
jgi:hypothetical protein